MRYRLRTLLIVLALGPALIALGWWAGAWIDSDSENRAAAFKVLAILITILAQAALILACAAVTFGVGIGIARLADAAIDVMARLSTRK